MCLSELPDIYERHRNYTHTHAIEYQNSGACSTADVQQQRVLFKFQKTETKSGVSRCVQNEPLNHMSHSWVHLAFTHQWLRFPTRIPAAKCEGLPTSHPGNDNTERTKPLNTMPMAFPRDLDIRIQYSPWPHLNRGTH